MSNRKLMHLRIEGDSSYEKNCNFKSIRMLSHSVVELFMYYLGKVLIDGNNNFVIYYKENDSSKNAYENEPYFNVSTFFVDSNELQRAKELQAKKNCDIFELDMMFLKSIENIMIKTCLLSGNEESVLKIEETVKTVIESNFELKYKIGKFSKKSEDSLYKATTYRHITPDGENYYLEVQNLQSKEIEIYQLNKQPEYVKMELMYTKSFWINHDFHLYSDDYHKDIVVINADDHTIIINRT